MIRRKILCNKIGMYLNASPPSQPIIVDDRKPYSDRWRKLLQEKLRDDDIMGGELDSPDKLGYGKCTFKAQSDESKSIDIELGMAKDQERNGLANTGRRAINQNRRMTDRGPT